MLSQKGTPKRTQSIPTALRRVPVQRYKEENDEVKEVKRKESAPDARQNGPSEAKLARKEEKPAASKLVKYKPPVKAGEEITASLPAKSRTTTVLLPKQRQISLGSASASKLRRREEDMNGWQFLNKDVGDTVSQAASPQNGGPGVNGSGEIEKDEGLENECSLE